jgi:hypothetical protein
MTAFNDCYLCQVYSQGPCPENAWLLPEGEDGEVYCECRDGFTFSPTEYNCQPLLSQPGHRLQSLWSNVAEYLERRRGQAGDVSAAEAGEAGPSVAAKRRRRWESPREPVVRRSRPIRRRLIATVSREANRSEGTGQEQEEEQEQENKDRTEEE